MKAVHNDPRHYTSSTELRRQMYELVRGSSSIRKESLERLALSAEILWQFKQHWSEKAKNQLNELITFDLDDFISQYPFQEEMELHRDDHACWACKRADQSDKDSMIAEAGDSPPLHFEWSWEDCGRMRERELWMQAPISSMAIDPVAKDTNENDNPCKDQLREQEVLDLVSEKCEQVEE